MSRSRRLLAVALAAAALSACSLAGDITPPPGARPLSNPTRPAVVTPAAPVATALPGSSPTEAGAVVPVSQAPSARPSAAQGAVLYADHCAACHGPTGQADGPMSANVPGGADVIPKFALPDRARANSMQTWFQVVTAGRLEKFMPPFNEKLTDAQRWDVVAFLYTLSTPQTQIDLGRTVYAANCAQCHGAGGRGDGAEAAGQTLRDFTEVAPAAAVAPAEIFEAVTTGAGIDGHAFEAELSEDERWAVTAFVRAFAYDYFAPGSPLPVQAGTITGQVVNGTAGAALTGEVVVNVLGFEPDAGVVQTLTGTVAADGRYSFTDVEYQPGRQFVVSASYGGITYYSEPAAFSPGNGPLELPVTVFEKTDDPAALRVDRIHLFILFETPGQVTIGQLYLFSNLGDRTFLPENGRTVEFLLPAGATGLTVQDGQDGVTFFRTETGFVDSVPILPGEGASQVLFSYSLPYDGALDFAQPVKYPVGQVNVLVGDMGVTLTGDQFVAGQASDVQGTPFQNYSRLGLDADQTLRFRLSGQPSSAAAAPPGPGGVTVGDTTSLAIGLGALAVTLLGIGVWWWRRSPSARPAGAASREDLLQAIAELDDDLAAGKVKPDEYEKERAWLKQELRKVWAKDGGR